MKKKLNIDDLIETEGPMNAVALDDAMSYLGIVSTEDLTVIEQRKLRAKKQKIVNSSKKMERRVSHEITRKVNRLD
jgi:hypothetical protein